MLTTEQRELVNKVHDFMAYTDNLITDKTGNIISNVDYKDIAFGSTILLFGGYRTIGFHAVDAMKTYHKKYNEWPDLVITGKASNKFDNTANLGSEVNIYQYILENCGIPKSVVRKYYQKPKDTSTTENTQALNNILEANPNLKAKPIVLFTQSYYARRAIHDFAQKMPKNKLIVANLPKADLDNGMFYNDREDGNAVDVMMGACFYQAMYNQTRWEKGETLAPTEEELKSIPSKEQIMPVIQKYCGWLYPNNIIDLGLADNLVAAKELIDRRKAEILIKKSLSPEQQKKDIINAVTLYRRKTNLINDNTQNL